MCRGHHNLIDDTSTDHHLSFGTRSQIRTTTGIPAPLIKRLSQPPQPLPIWPTIIICVGNNVSLSLTGALYFWLLLILHVQIQSGAHR